MNSVLFSVPLRCGTTSSTSTKRSRVGGAKLAKDGEMVLANALVVEVTAAGIP